MQRMPSEAWTGELALFSPAGKLSTSPALQHASGSLRSGKRPLLLQAGVWAQETPPACGVGKGMHAVHLHDPLRCAREHI